MTEKLQTFGVFRSRSSDGLIVDGFDAVALSEARRQWVS